MQSKFYLYKVEFQQRGAGHVQGVLWVMMDVLERPEWIKEVNTDQSRAQTDPRVRVVTETISNKEVRVYRKEEFNQISEEEKNQMNMLFRGLKSWFQKLCKEGKKITH